jgi:AcrR family transcriptional regulator
MTAADTPGRGDDARPGRRIAQQRGRATYDSLVDTGFRLLEDREFDEITIADLAREAGYSVGAFYARFRSKDEILDAMVVRHLEQRSRARNQVLAGSRSETLIEQLVRDLATYYWKHRRFWRAALSRGLRDPKFWKPLRAQAGESADAVIGRITEMAGRPLTEDESTNIRFAFQFALGMINNSIVNRPGRVLPQGQRRFVESLARAVRLVSDYDRIVGL